MVKLVLQHKQMCNVKSSNLALSIKITTTKSTKTWSHFWREIFVDTEHRQKTRTKIDFHIIGSVFNHCVQSLRKKLVITNMIKNISNTAKAIAKSWVSWYTKYILQQAIFPTDLPQVLSDNVFLMFFFPFYQCSFLRR